jgi:hypothetical protein
LTFKKNAATFPIMPRQVRLAFSGAFYHVMARAGICRPIKAMGQRLKTDETFAAKRAEILEKSQITTNPY